MPKIQAASKSARIRTPRTVAAKAARRPVTLPAASGENEDTQHRRLLVGVAYHSGIGKPDCCLTALAVLSASRALRRELDRGLGTKGISECSFLALVTLYAVEPIACSPDTLAHDVEIDLEGMREVLGFMEKQGWVSWEHHETQGCSSRVHLTEAGVEITIPAVHRFLDISATLTGCLGAEQRAAAIQACAQIVRAVAASQNERAKEEFHP